MREIAIVSDAPAALRDPIHPPCSCTLTFFPNKKKYYPLKKKRSTFSQKKKSYDYNKRTGKKIIK